MSIKFGQLVFVSAAFAALIAASGAQAQTQGKPLGLYSRMDSNGDGKVSLAEFEATHATQLARFDTNKDGTVTLAEVDAFFAGHLQGPGAQLTQQRLANLKAADANGDGIISADEFKAVGDAEFHRADTNGDGFIDAHEADVAVP